MTVEMGGEAVEWLLAEWKGHARTKYGEGNPGHDVNGEAIKNLDYERMFNFVLNYLKRVELFGLDTPQGKQALGKAATTLVDYVDRTMEIHGAFPMPGLPSGEIEAWL